MAERGRVEPVSFEHLMCSIGLLVVPSKLAASFFKTENEAARATLLHPMADTNNTDFS